MACTGQIYEGNGTRSGWVSASSQYSGDYAAAEAFDGATGSANRWTSEDANPPHVDGSCWFDTDFQVPQQMNGIRLLRRAAATTTNFPKDIVIYGSSTGAFAGEEVEVCDGQTNDAAPNSWSAWIDFSAPGLYQYLRIEIHSMWQTSAYGRVMIQEIQWCQTPVVVAGAFDLGCSLTASGVTGGTIVVDSGPLTAIGALTATPGIGIATGSFEATAELATSGIFSGIPVDVGPFTLAGSMSATLREIIVVGSFVAAAALTATPGLAVVISPFTLTAAMATPTIQQLKIDTDTAQIVYILTLTGSPNIEIPIASFQGRVRSGDPTYLSVVVPGLDYSAQIAARSSGVLKLDAAYKKDGEIIQREERIRVDLETIRIDEGSRNKSITLVGHKTASYSAKAVTLRGLNYTCQQADGKLRVRSSIPDMFLNPGDTLTAGDDTFTVGMISYTVGASQQTMEVTEA